MHQIKRIPEDFVVQEIVKLPESHGKAGYSYFLLKKREYNTIDALKRVAINLKVPFKWTGYAGLKDRNAVTSQLVSIRNANPEKTEGLGIPGISLEFIGQGNVPVTMGSLEGNIFRITVRNIDKTGKASAEENIALLGKMGFFFPNYFGAQRFGTWNSQVGAAILRRDFAKAAGLMLASNTRFHPISSYLESHPRDYVGALKIVPKKLAFLYIHSYQASLFNRVAAHIIKSESGKFREAASHHGTLVFPESEVKNISLPLVGFGTDFRDYTPEIGQEFSRLLGDDGIGIRNFIIRSIPQLTFEGAERELLAKAGDFQHSFSDDELNPGMRKCLLEFHLPKGSYATILIQALFP
ncbi:tRNA pseudouridine(13) synthase TruD [Candidatus Woesearchaeota archaeon]|nr:tRNA pseudouridine(13) synthase TruD [Candidatus Woesearchaeota archaeon]